MGRVLDVLDGSMTRKQDRRNFFKAQLLFGMLCATDGHAKNFSLLIRLRMAAKSNSSMMKWSLRHP